MMRDRILQGAQEMGIDLADTAAEKMGIFWEQVLETNMVMNLTRVVDEEQACALHFLDSLAPLLYGESMIKQGATICDVGTGCGFPGVPLAIARPDLAMTLLDARKKRLEFIDGALLPIQTKAQTLHSRIEDVDLFYDVLCARAMAALPALCRLLVPRLAIGGIAILWKGPGVLAEMDEAAALVPTLGGRLLAPISYEIAGTDHKRLLILVEKISETPKEPEITPAIRRNERNLAKSKAFASKNQEERCRTI